jgi:lipopolysaccharide export system permease protein
MIQRLDRYVLGSFLRHWSIVAGSFLSLFTVLDLVGESDEIGDAAEKFGPVAADTALYYLSNLPFLLVQFAPYITLLASLATVMQLLRNHEWTPMLTAGRSAIRAFAPMLVAALAIGVLISLVREQFFPLVQSVRAEYQSKLFVQESWAPKEVWLRGPKDQRMFLHTFHPGETPSIDGLELFTLDPRGQDLFLRADHATWDGTYWQLQHGRFMVGGDRSTERLVDRLDEPGLGPDDIERAWVGQNQPLELTLNDAAILLQRDPGHRQAATLMWALRFAPFTHLILLLLGLPYVLSFERRSSLEGVAIGLLLCAFFFVADFLFQDLGQRGMLSAWLAGLAPALLFGGFGLRGLDRLPT